MERVTAASCRSEVYFTKSVGLHELEFASTGLDSLESVCGKHLDLLLFRVVVSRNSSEKSNKYETMCFNNRLNSTPGKRIVMKIAGCAFVLASLLFTSALYAQSNELPGDAALKHYYQNLGDSLAESQLSDIPFDRVSITVRANESLASLAKRNTFAGLDFLHLAVAIYQTNPSAFRNGNPALLQKGATLQMPDVEDLLEARSQYERLSIVGNDMDFFGDLNVMRSGERFPLGRDPGAAPNVALPLAEVKAKFDRSEALVVWDVSLWGKRRAFTEHVEKLAELVAEKTNGEFFLNLAYGGLSEPTENLDGIASGKFEMAQFCAGYHHDKNRSITVLELPFLGVKSLEEERHISQWLYRHPTVIQDLARWNAIALMPSPLPQYNLAGIGAAPQKLSDFSGLSIRATGGIGKAVAAVGAIPTPTIASEVGEALDEGFIEAVAFAPHAHMSFGTIDTADWWTTNLNPGTVNCPVVASVADVNKLAPQYREALYSSINEALDYYIANYRNDIISIWGSALEQRGIEKVTFSDAEIDAFRLKVAGPAAASWIEDNTKAGLPAQEIYDLVISTLNGINSELNEQSNLPTALDERVTSSLVATTVAAPGNDDDNYLGSPRNSALDVALTVDPLQYLVEWDLKTEVSVGAVLSRLATYIGYELVGDNSLVYQRLLPLVHRRVAEITVGEGFEVLAGAGFVTVFDHATRSVTLRPKRNGQTSRGLPDCPPNIGMASQIAEGVLLLSDGSECRY